jgi:hypothetical protein
VFIADSQLHFGDTNVNNQFKQTFYKELEVMKRLYEGYIILSSDQYNPFMIFRFSNILYNTFTHLTKKIKLQCSYKNDGNF